MTSINPRLFVFSLIAFLVATRLYALVTPSGLYFTFSAFIFNNRDLDKAIALILKLLVPFLVGALLVWALYRADRVQAGLNRDRTIRAMVMDQATASISMAGAMTALLMAWPYILLWDILIDPTLAQYRFVYTFAYFLYIFAYGLFALSGAETARAHLYRAEFDAAPAPAGGRRFTIDALLGSRYAKPAVEALGGAVATAVAAFISGRPG